MWEWSGREEWRQDYAGCRLCCDGTRLAPRGQRRLTRAKRDQSATCRTPATLVLSTECGEPRGWCSSSRPGAAGSGRWRRRRGCRARRFDVGEVAVDGGRVGKDRVAPTPLPGPGFAPWSTSIVLGGSWSPPAGTMTVHHESSACASVASSVSRMTSVWPPSPSGTAPSTAPLTMVLALHHETAHQLAPGEAPGGHAGFSSLLDPQAKLLGSGVPAR